MSQHVAPHDPLIPQQSRSQPTHAFPSDFAIPTLTLSIPIFNAKYVNRMHISSNSGFWPILFPSTSVHSDVGVTPRTAKEIAASGVQALLEMTPNMLQSFRTSDKPLFLDEFRQEVYTKRNRDKLGTSKLLFRQFSIIPTSSLQTASSSSTTDQADIFRATHPCGLYEVLIIPSGITQVHNGVNYSIVQVTYPANTTDKLPDNCHHRVIQKGISAPYDDAMKDYSPIDTTIPPPDATSSTTSTTATSTGIPRDLQVIPKSIPEIPFPLPLNNTNLQVHPMYYNFSLPTPIDSILNSSINNFNDEIENPGTTCAPPSQPFRPIPNFLPLRPEVTAALKEDAKQAPQTPIQLSQRREFQTLPYPQINNIFSILQGLFPTLSYLEDNPRTQTEFPNRLSHELIPFVIPFSIFYLDLLSLESVYTFIVGLLHLQTWRNQHCSYFPVNRTHELILPQSTNVIDAENTTGNANENNKTINENRVDLDAQIPSNHPSHHIFKVLIVIYNAERLDTQPILTTTLDELAGELDMEFSYQHFTTVPIDPTGSIDKIDVPINDNRVICKNSPNKFISAQFYEQAVHLGHFVVKNILSQYLLSHTTYHPQRCVHRTFLHEISFDLFRLFQHHRSLLLNSPDIPSKYAISPHFPRTFDNTLSIHPKHHSTRPLLQQYYILYEKYLNRLDEEEEERKREQLRASPSQSETQLQLQSLSSTPRYTPNEEQQINLKILLGAEHEHQLDDSSTESSMTHLSAEVQVHHLDFPIFTAGDDIYEYFATMLKTRPIFEHVLIQDQHALDVTNSDNPAPNQSRCDQNIDQRMTKTVVAPFHRGSGLFRDVQYAKTAYLEPSLCQPQGLDRDKDNFKQFVMNQLAPISTSVSKYTPHSVSPPSSAPHPESPIYNPNSLLPVHTLPPNTPLNFTFTAYAVPNSVFRYVVTTTDDVFRSSFPIAFSEAQAQTAAESGTLYGSSISYRSILSTHLNSPHNLKSHITQGNQKHSNPSPHKLHHFFVNCSMHSNYPYHSASSASGLQISPQAIPGIAIVHFGCELDQVRFANFINPLLHFDPFRARNTPIFFIFIAPPNTTPVPDAADFASGKVSSDTVLREKSYTIVEQPSTPSPWSQIKLRSTEQNKNYAYTQYLQRVAEQYKIEPVRYNEWFTAHVLRTHIKSIYASIWPTRRVDLLNTIGTNLLQHLGKRSQYRSIAENLSRDITATSQIIPILKSACRDFELGIQPLEAKFKAICDTFDSFYVKNEEELRAMHEKSDPNSAKKNPSLVAQQRARDRPRLFYQLNSGTNINNYNLDPTLTHLSTKLIVKYHALMKQYRERKSDLIQVQTSIQQFKSFISMFEAELPRKAAAHVTRPTIDQFSEQPPSTPYKIYQYVISIDQLGDTLRTVRELALVEYLTAYSLVWDNPSNPAMHL